MTIVGSLSQRNPQTSTAELITSLIPPPHFMEATFANYIPDPRQSSQAIAVRTAKEFVAFSANPEKKAFRRVFSGKSSVHRRTGLYLDGGFGVGKTHLLAAAWHLASGEKAFGTFMEYTNLVGAIGFRGTVEALKRHTLVAIDEFELDDPGDTVLMSRLMRELADAGVKLMATSNTLPEALGEDRFAAADFRREIQALADQFVVLRIDGEDYRHRNLEEPPASLDPADVEFLITNGQAKNISIDSFDELLGHLATIHPSRYRRLVAGIDAVVWKDVATVRDQGVALRLVVLIDRLYDAGIAVFGTGESFSRLFASEMLGGGYQKKYYRALSRITALTRLGRRFMPDSDHKEGRGRQQDGA